MAASAALATTPSSATPGALRAGKSEGDPLLYAAAQQHHYSYTASCSWECAKDKQCRQVSCDFSLTASNRSEADALAQGKARYLLEIKASGQYGPGHRSGAFSLSLKGEF